MIGRPSVTLEGREGLVAGIADGGPVARGRAEAFRDLGAELAVTYRNEKAGRFVEPLARRLEAPIPMPAVPGRPEQLSTRLAFFVAGFGMAAWLAPARAVRQGPRRAR